MLQLCSTCGTSSQECQARLGTESAKKQAEVDHLGRLVEGLQLDKDILTQLKVVGGLHNIWYHPIGQPRG